MKEDPRNNVLKDVIDIAVGYVCSRVTIQSFHILILNYL